jgi:hypothetical protein
VPEHPVTPSGDKPAVPSGPSAQPGKAGTIGVQGARPGSTAEPQGLIVDPSVAEASQRINGIRTGLPDDYAVQPTPAALKAAAGQQGVLTDKDGHYYMASGGKTYAARFDRDNGTWRVWQPDNAYRPQYPVRLDAQGNWQVHYDVGLKGGMDPAVAGPSTQQFERAYRISTSTGSPPSASMQQTLNPQTWTPRQTACSTTRRSDRRGI